MKLFEVQAGQATWWIAAVDEADVLTHLRDELYSLEVSEEETDDALIDPEIVELNKDYAKLIDIVDEFGDRIYTIWDLFKKYSGPGVVHTDFVPNTDSDALFDAIDEETLDVDDWDSLTKKGYEIDWELD